MSDQVLLQEIAQCENDLSHFQKNLSLDVINQWPALMIRLRDLLDKVPEEPANQNVQEAFHSVYMNLEKTILQIQQFKKNLTQDKYVSMGSFEASVIYNKFQRKIK